MILSDLKLPTCILPSHDYVALRWHVFQLVRDNLLAGFHIVEAAVMAAACASLESVLVLPRSAEIIARMC